MIQTRKWDGEYLSINYWNGMASSTMVVLDAERLSSVIIEPAGGGWALCSGYTCTIGVVVRAGVRARTAGITWSEIGQTDHLRRRPRTLSRQPKCMFSHVRQRVSWVSHLT